MITRGVFSNDPRGERYGKSLNYEHIVDILNSWPLVFHHISNQSTLLAAIEKNSRDQYNGKFTLAS